MIHILFSEHFDFDTEGIPHGMTCRWEFSDIHTSEQKDLCFSVPFCHNILLLNFHFIFICGPCPVLMGTNKSGIFVGFGQPSRSILECLDLAKFCLRLPAITCEYPLYKVGVVEFQLSDVYLITRATRFSVDQI